jgi:ferredoxin-NADP reductase
MADYEARLKSRETVAEGTMAFRLEKPPGFAFTAGQAVDVLLGSERHTFSLVSAPFEEELVFATRMRAASAYKRALGALPIGAKVKLEGPAGSFVLDPDPARGALFIAGGIGITPFMSMLRQATRGRSPQPLRLLYSNRRPEDAAFLAELQELERRNANFRLAATMTDMGKSSRQWSGHTGFVDAGLIKSCARELHAPLYYVVGPPAMVLAMQETLRTAGVEDGAILTEEFYGY